MGKTIQVAELPQEMTRLDITTYGSLEKVNEVISKSRVRIFYKGMNRNRTFITDDFANQLIQSLPYTPIKGIFSYAKEDYEDHGEDNAEGKIYGIVPENPNFKWEKHLDSDGVEREYACADVYLFTALYGEAMMIPDKGQSMELYRPALVGEWRISPQDGKPYFHFESGCLLGLQVLGDDVEPCFEGAQFFSLYKDAKELLNYIKNFSKKEEEGKMEITKDLFRLSDNEKADLIFSTLNPNYESDYEIKYHLCEVYDDYAICFNTDTRKYERVYYTKSEDSVTIGDSVEVYIMDVTETEKAALEAMKAVGGTYELINEKISEMTSTIESLEKEKAEFSATIKAKEATIAEYEAAKQATAEKIVEYETSISEKDTTIAEYTTRIETLESEKTVLESEKADIKSECDSLAEFKKTIETEKKETILTEFSSHLNDEQIQSFKDSFDKYSVEDFEKEVCTTAYKSDSTMFSKKSTEPDYIYKDSQTTKKSSGVIGLLENYKNGGNK